MNTPRLFVLGLVLLLCGCGMGAPRHNPGYADLDGLSGRDVDSTMRLSFGPTVLRFAASMIEDDPVARELLRNLDGVRIRVYEVDGDPTSIAEDLNAMSTRLRERGWEPVILVREEGETTHVLLKIEQQRIAGLTLLTSDSLEVVLVNVMGELRPDLFQEAMAAIEAPVPNIDV